VQHVDAEKVKSYVQDFRTLLEEADFTQSKTFLRSFVKKVIINGDKAKVQYHLPMPPDGKKTQFVGVLPIDTPWWSRGDSNPLPFDCQSNVLPSELRPRGRIVNLAQIRRR
jgi:hypothetical protein